MALLKLAFTVVLVLVPRLVTANGDDVAKRGSNVERGARALESKANTNQTSCSPTEVAFAVRFTHDPVYLGYNGLLKFDKILTSIGGSYNPRNGHFTVPVSGIYVFYARLMLHNKNGLDVALLRYGVAVAVMHADGSNGYDQGSLLITYPMEKGDSVVLKHTSGSTTVRGGPWTVFGGFLVTPA